MILTAYLDESGTHGDAELSVMAGFVGDARQWRKFEKRSLKLFRRFKVDIFHTIDIRRTDKDFAGWTVDRKIEFLDEFQHIINETTEHGYAAILSSKDYEYYAKLQWPRGIRKDSKYAILFRAVFAAVVGNVVAVPRWAFGEEPKLKVVLESGHKNSQDVLRVYNWANSRFGDRSSALSGLTFETKQNCLPIAAADLFAYSVYGKETGQKPMGVSRKPTKADVSYRGNLSRLALGQEQLDSLHRQAIELASH
jgi:uncharacterized protein DUF3800